MSSQDNLTVFLSASYGCKQIKTNTTQINANHNPYLALQDVMTLFCVSTTPPVSSTENDDVWKQCPVDLLTDLIY